MKTILFIVCMVLTSILFSQKIQVELGTTHDFFASSYGKHYGGLLSAKLQLKSTNHFEWYTGMTYQNITLDESTNKFASEVTAFTKEKGGYIVTEIDYFPFQKKHWWIGITAFAGLTHQHIKGKALLESVGLSTTYNHRYTYFNYGISQQIGYRFNSFQIGTFAWLSLKGITDTGEFRPGDFDSRFLVGINAAYTFN